MAMSAIISKESQIYLIELQLFMIYELGFTGHVEELIGAFTCIVNPIYYHLYTGLTTIMHRLRK